MPTQYRIELGFDWNSSPITGSEVFAQPMESPKFIYPLQIALAKTSQGGGNPAFFTGFEGGDQLNFWLFDITDILNGTAPWDSSGYTIDAQSGLTVTFQQNGADVDPFTTPNSWEIVPQAGVSASWAYSTAGQTYGFAPVNAVIQGRNSNWATLSPPSSPVTYELSLKLILTRSNQTKTFVTDPELIVGDSGGSGSP